MLTPASSPVPASSPQLQHPLLLPITSRPVRSQRAFVPPTLRRENASLSPEYFSPAQAQARSSQSGTPPRSPAGNTSFSSQGSSASGASGASGSSEGDGHSAGGGSAGS